QEAAHGETAIARAYHPDAVAIERLRLGLLRTHQILGRIARPLRVAPLRDIRTEAGFEQQLIGRWRGVLHLLHLLVRRGVVTGLRRVRACAEEAVGLGAGVD